MANKERVREVNELRICCTNHREGCGWVGELGGLKSHIDSDKGCGYVKVTCTNKGCWVRLNRKDLQTHLQEKCYYQLYECEHCGHKDTYTAITGKTAFWEFGGHHSECLEFPLDCPNRCGVTGIRRRAMPDHRSSCPLEPLDCPFKDAGCTEKIARKNMEDHMTANLQMHVLLTFQGYEEWKQLVSREIGILEKTIHDHTTVQSLKCMKSFLQASLNKIGDTLTFRVTDFPQLRKQKKPWYSAPFSIGDQVRVHLAVYPTGIGQGQGSHLSLSLILMDFLRNEEHMCLQYNVSVTAIGQSRSPTIIELCIAAEKDSGNHPLQRLLQSLCSACFRFPSPGEVLRSEQLFLEIEEANCLLVNDSMILELKLMKHQHCWPS